MVIWHLTPDAPRVPRFVSAGQHVNLQFGTWPIEPGQRIWIDYQVLHQDGRVHTTWHSNKFLSLIMDGAVLPILHLNGYKIPNPTVLARISRAEIRLPVYMLAVDEESWIVRETARLVL